jgi:hypothetical protein
MIFKENKVAETTEKSEMILKREKEAIDFLT